MRLIFVLISFFISLQCRADVLSEGEYLVRAAGCADCHTANAAMPFAGGYRLATPFGTFYSPNITPDKETGIGDWTEENLRRALREGRSPGWKIYYPVFPYRSYTKMTDDDIHKIYSYLMSLQPVRNQNRAHELGVVFGQRWLMFFWQSMFFWGKPDDPIKRAHVGVGEWEPDKNQTAQWNRGAYLAEAVMHCAECHTPRNALGSPEESQWMAGTSDALNGVTIPNITPDPRTGITWSKEEWIQFFASGYTPKGKTPRAEMAEVILNSSRLTKEDREALAIYLRTLTPIEHFTR